ncbi:unnamed protein product [Clonostachys rosea]|uniref:Nephrocystin 3-like N-terminal domain-containing protein n=1 Tax=Bionectria ochroleuca TaxID=29856 RepID=A0ABY6UUV7_BIOOC|nr:unnamed protein product [Clonostachys rosea]
MPGSVNTADEYEFIDYEEVALSPEDVAKVRDWLQPTDYLADSGEFRRHLLSQAPGTGLWICETDAYRKWHDSLDHGSLWINGVPGAGKSVTASSIIQHLKTTEDCPVLFFFFRNIVAANFSPRGLLQDWLAQLLPYSPRLQVALRARIDTSLEDISDSNLVELFTDGISCVPRLYCVVDALDEMTAGNRAFLEHLNRLATYRPRSLKLLMTSRPKQYLQSALRDSSIVHVSLQKKLVDRDILLYLNHRFDGVLSGQHLERDKIIDMVASRSEGLFLYAKLAMDQVEAVLTSQHAISIDELEKTLPAGLQDTYDKMLSKQREEHGVSIDTQVLVLQAVTHASRPLRLNELASLIEFCPSKGFKALVAKSCGPLVEILEDETLQVVHHSFTEFLRGDTRNASAGEASTRFPIIDSPTAHKTMATNCLRYLQSGPLGNAGESDISVTYRNPIVPYLPIAGERRLDIIGYPFHRPKDEDPFKYQEARLLHPFLQYAVTSWHGHASSYDVEDEDFFAVVLDFLKPESVAFRRWLKLEWGATSKSQDSADGLPTALHLAAYSGLSKFCLKIVKDGASVSSLDAHERTPLHWAAVNGHQEVVSLLIKNRCDPNAEDAYGMKPIHLAARRNHAAAVTLLLETGIEPDTIKTRENRKSGRMKSGEPITRGEDAILYASKGGHIEIILAMIPFCKGKVLERLLCQSCQHGLIDPVLAILEKTDVSVNARFREGTALYFACRATSVKCVEALIKRGADVSMMSTFKPRRWRVGGDCVREKETAPLHCLVRSWTDQNDKDCRAILKLLLNAGADLEQVSGSGNTPLLIAAGGSETNYRAQGHSFALKALLEAGADVTKELRGESILHLVLDRYRDPSIVRLLIEHGIDPNKKDSRGVSILQCCIRQSGMVTGVENTLTIVKYMLDQGADPNMSDDNGNSAVKEAMSCEEPEVFTLLLSKCTNDLIKRECWFRLPSVYKAERFTSLMKQLLADGIDINTESKDGRTLYLLCLREEERLQLIREHGAKTDMVDKYGNNALHLLARSGSIVREQMERRIADGVDPLSRDNDGNTLLHHIIPSYNTTEEWAIYIRWLISLGICINAVDTSGRTILHHYLTRCSRGGTVREKNRFHFIDAINFEGKINFEIRDKDGFAPIHIAATETEIELANLVRGGADPTFLTQGGQNILHLASCARMPGIVGLILYQFGTDGLEQEDNLGRTPLHYACASGEVESVAFLLQQGANVHATDSNDRTPLHACANFKEELALWESGTRRYESLVATREDRFRPQGSQEQSGRRIWYKSRYGGQPTKRMRRTHFTGITSIVHMLLDAGADVAAMRSDCTALDEALDSGCWEFVEPFFSDEDLFLKATKPLEDDSAYSESVKEIRQRMRAQMALMQPRSYLGGNSPATSEVLLHPELYLDLLSRDDIVQIVNEAFDADPTATSNYDTLKDLIKFGDLRVLEGVSRLVLHYSSYDAVRDTFEKGKKESKYKYSTAESTALQMACDQSKSNMKTVRFLVEKLHVDVNAAKAVIENRYKSDAEIERGGTALHILASANEWWKLEAMRYLLANGADANTIDEKGQTALHIAAHGMQYADRDISGFWKLDAVRILLDNGANPDILDNKGETALHRASSAPDVMAELLKRGADAILGKRSPLFKAIHDQNLAALDTLLDHGLSVDTLDTSRKSEDIHYSLSKPDRAVYALLATAFAEELNSYVPESAPLLRSLVKRGANLYLPLNEQETLIHFLFEFPEYEVLDTLLQDPCVARIDFNRRDQRGRTVLMASCAWHEALPGYFYRHWVPKVRGPPLRILDLEADATLVDDEGKTALHYLLDNAGMPDEVLIEFIQRKEVASTLLLKDKAGYSPLHYALRILRPDICELLLSLGADLLEPDPNGFTALHYIADQWHLTTRSPGSESARLSVDLPQEYFGKCLALWNRFLAEGGSINSVDNAGNTPMHVFLLSGIRNTARYKEEEQVQCCHVSFYEKLFPAESGADLFAVNHDGESMLHVVGRSPYSGDSHDTLLFEALVHKGLDPLSEDGRGRSSLDVASACQKDGIVELLGRK